jgi:hypothetical protein
LKRLAFDFIVIAVLLVLFIGSSVVSAANNSTVNETPTEIPILFSFQGGHSLGENPIEIVSSNGEISFIGNTSSKAISLPPDPDYIIRIEPAGLSDKINSPDSSFIDLGRWAANNPIGAFGLVLVFAIILIKVRRKP